MSVRTARTAWNGSLQEGSGQVELSSSELGTFDVSWPKRTSDTADGTMPLLSDALVEKIQAGRRLELRFDFMQEPRNQEPSFDGSAVVDLQAGPGGRAVAAVRRCADQPTQHLAETPRGR